MKLNKGITLLVLATTLCANAYAATTTYYLADSTSVSCDIESGYVSRGSTGDKVKLLQNFLWEYSYLTADSYYSAVDGVFGEKTENAVRRFQSDSGLTVDGKAGPATFKALQNYYNM